MAKKIGKRIIRLTEVGSTNTYLKENSDLELSKAILYLYKNKKIGKNDKKNFFFPVFFFLWFQARQLFLKDSGTTIQIPVTCCLLIRHLRMSVNQLVLRTFSEVTETDAGTHTSSPTGHQSEL